jgi:5-formyltetrahydrofolate cyclo-ligase
MKHNQNTKATIRHAMRLKRSQISPKEQTEKADQLMQIVVQLPVFIQSEHIAAYWPYDGELNPLPILAEAHAMEKSCYLPKLAPTPTVQMQFVEYQPGDPLSTNALGILEPILDAKKTLSAALLDLVLVPLVAFDQTGQSLGMGKGYYDRAFDFLKTNPRSKPFFLGIAYDLQQCLDLPADTWDIRLHAIATETSYMDFV